MTGDCTRSAATSIALVKSSLNVLNDPTAYLLLNAGSNTSFNEISGIVFPSFSVLTSGPIHSPKITTIRIHKKVDTRQCDLKNFLQSTFPASLCKSGNPKWKIGASLTRSMSMMFSDPGINIETEMIGPDNVVIVGVHPQETLKSVYRNIKKSRTFLNSAPPFCACLPVNCGSRRNCYPRNQRPIFITYGTNGSGSRPGFICKVPSETIETYGTNPCSRDCRYASVICVSPTA
jgi:hypothetical protein